MARTGRVAAALIDAGAPVNGQPGDSETPLMTAASYGDAEVAQVLIEAGADIEARASADAGGVPGGTALMHAAVFGMTEVLDLFRALKIRLDQLSTDLVSEAQASDASLSAIVRLTDDRGEPLCATAPQSHLIWALEADA